MKKADTVGKGKQPELRNISDIISQSEKRVRRFLEQRKQDKAEKKRDASRDHCSVRSCG